MLNEPPSPDQQRNSRSVHPLERDPAPPPQNVQSQSVMLHIPYVKPFITYGLIALNLAIFMLGLSQPRLNDLMLNNGANNQYEVLFNGEYLRLLFAMFLHGSIAHIFFNMYSLYIVGSTIEGLFGHARFALIYFFGGLTGSLFSILLNPPEVFSVGASGAVFALFGAEIIYLYQHRKLLGENGRRQLQNLLVVAGINLAVGIMSSFNTAGVRIDNWGHIGGFVGGLALTWFIGPVLLPHRHPQRENALIAEDINPLKRRSQVLSIYATIWLAVLIIATLAIRS